MILVSGILQATLLLNNGDTVVYKTSGELYEYTLSRVYDILDTLEATYSATIVDWEIIDDE